MSARAFQKEELIRQLDGAIQHGDVPAITEEIQGILTRMIHSGGLQLPAAFHSAPSDHYARRLLHRNPRLGYTAVVMTWAPGHATPLHDHSGMWCVEGVVAGEMKVARFNLLQHRERLYQFQPIQTIFAGVGSSGNLIPPFEYHILANALPDQASITLHVYGGEMDHCCIFEPRTDGWYERVEKSLAYTD